MYSPQVAQQIVPLAYAGGTALNITFPITYNGTSPVDTTITMYIYEGSSLPTHGALVATYNQSVHFDPGESKDVVFQHTAQSTGEGRRDVGLAIFVDSQEVTSKEWDDVFYVQTTGGWGTQITGLMTMAAMMAMVAMLGTATSEMMKEK